MKRDEDCMCGVSRSKDTIRHNGFCRAYVII